MLGYVVVDLTSNERVAARLETQPFPTASTIKLSILYELLKQCEEGKLALDKPALLERAQVVGGSGVLQHLSGPLLSLVGSRGADDHRQRQHRDQRRDRRRRAWRNVNARMKALGLRRHSAAPQDDGRRRRRGAATRTSRRRRRSRSPRSCSGAARG